MKQTKKPVLKSEVLLNMLEDLEKTKQRLEQYKFMVESAHDAIFFKDLKSRYQVVNKKTLKVFGLPMEKVIGKNDYELMPNRKEAKKNIQDDQAIFKTRTSKEINKHMTTPDGKEYWFHAIKVPQFDEKGKVIGLVGIARDITELKKTEQKLKQAKQRFQQFFDNAPVYCYMISPKATILDINKTTLKALGYKKDELLNKPLKAIYAPESWAKAKRLFKKWKQEGQIKDQKMTIITKKGKKRKVLLSANTVKDKKGKILYSISMQHNITDLKI